MSHTPILVLNAGSSSLKFSLYDSTGDAPLPLCRGRVEGMHWQPSFRVEDARGQMLHRQAVDTAGQVDHDLALSQILDWLGAHYGAALPIGAVAHRIVHGGADYVAPVRLDEAVLADLTALVPLAPLHQPHNLALVRKLWERAPDLPQVACFDTAFHHTRPKVAKWEGLPREYADAGIQRYGFHGLSYEYIAGVLPQFDEQAASGRTIVLHLGNGASMCALQAGRSIATTMGFTALDGLVMATRCGRIDPGVLLYLLQQGMDVDTLQELLYHRSGLLGVSGVASDMRALRDSDHPHAEEAIELFIYRIGLELGGLTAALQGLDAIVFTAGIGEHDAALREHVCRDAAWLGVELDEELNEAGGPRISRLGSRVSAWVIPTDEEWMMARHADELLNK